MKKSLSKLGSALLAVISIVFFILLLPFIIIQLIIMLPFDYRRYKKSLYYQNLKKSYRLFKGKSDIVMTYEAIGRKALEFQYICNEDFEYFINDGVVFINETGDNWDEKDGHITFICYDDDGNEIAVSPQEYFGEEVNVLAEHKGLPIRIFVNLNDIEDDEQRELLIKSDYFYCIDNLKDFNKITE